MSNVITFNSSNAVQSSSNNSYSFNFLSGSYRIKEGATMSVRNVVLPYSWFNVNATVYNNASFSYTWVDGSTYTITLQNGFYQTSDINNALQNSFIANGLYLINSTGQNVYYIVLLTDQNLYADQVLTFTVPTSLPSGYTAPANLYSNFYSTPTPVCPSLTITANNFGQLIGFKAGSYPTSITVTTNQSFISSFTPNASPVNSIIMRCNLCDNNVTMPSDILDSFTFQGTSFGSNGLYQPFYKSNIKLKPGTYNNIIITFVDQNYNTIFMNDTNILVTLLIDN